MTLSFKGCSWESAAPAQKRTASKRNTVPATTAGNPFFANVFSLFDQIIGKAF